MIYKIHFDKIGRHENVNITVKNLKEQTLAKEFKKYLSSRDFEWDINLDEAGNGDGILCVGWLVFRFTVKEERVKQ